MVFSSHLFVYYFLPLALLAYYAAPKRARHLVLTLASYFFYGWSNPAFTILMLASTVVDYGCGLFLGGWRREAWREPLTLFDPALPRERGHRIAVAVSVVTNLSLLGFFKYFNFAVENYYALVSRLGFEGQSLDSVLRIVLPLGISFYTFQSMSYTIDVYRGRVAPLSNFIDFACYVSMFPQLVAGPIIRFSEIADQLADRRHTIAKVARGIAFFSVGMAKKILLANPCGAVADATFTAGTPVWLDAWFGLFAYSFQIYFDFSGYSDMALGLGLMLGFVFPKNFDSPYRAHSIMDFWRRWHISLSSWLRDYLYIPLGGNRLGTGRTYVNIAIVMLLGGLWHGASWNFVLWGAFHGALLAGERALQFRIRFERFPVALRQAAIFLLVCVGWVLFRAPDLPSALQYLGSMFGAVGVPPGAQLANAIIYQPYHFAAVVAAALVAFVAPQSWDWVQELSWAKAAACLALLWASLMALTVQSYNPFIYFIF